MMSRFNSAVSIIVSKIGDMFKDDINRLNYNGRTQLTEAVVKGNLRRVEFLIDKGADVNAKSEHGLMSIDSAVSNGHVEIVKFLLEHCAEVNSRRTSGWTTLMHAIDDKPNCLKIIKLLIDAGAEINTGKNNDDKTALMTATHCGNIDVINLLLANNADINIRTEDDKTAFDYLIVYFETFQQREIIELEDIVFEPEVIDEVKTNELREKARPFFDTARIIDHIVKNEPIEDNERKLFGTIVNNSELFDIAFQRLKTSLSTSNVDITSAINTQKYKSKINLSKYFEAIMDKAEDTDVKIFLSSMMQRYSQILKDEEQAAMYILEEVAQIENLLFIFKLYRNEGDKDKKILTYDALKVALEFEERSKSVGSKSKSMELSVYKEMLTVYEANPEYKNTGYVLQSYVNNIAGLKDVILMLTDREKKDFMTHLNNIYEKVPNIITPKIQTEIISIYTERYPELVKTKEAKDIEIKKNESEDTSFGIDETKTNAASLTHMESEANYLELLGEN